MFLKFHINNQDTTEWKTRWIFKKIYIPNSISGQPDRFVAVINLNYMFPIKSDTITYFQLSKIDECKKFDNENDKSQYIDLLKKEMTAMNQLD